MSFNNNFSILLLVVLTLPSIQASGQFSTPPNDPLLEGDIYKLAVTENGIYKISGQWMKDALKINLSTVTPNKIQIFGMPGGKIEENSDDSTPFIQELAYKTYGTEDGKFDEQDYLIFYSENQNKWQWDEVTARYLFEINPFANQNFIFLKVNGNTGKRITKEPSNSVPTRLETDYLYRDIYHLDKFNLLGKDLSTQGSGQEWVGEEISNNLNFDLKNVFEVQALNELKNIHFELQLIGRSDKPENIDLLNEGQTFRKSFSPVEIGDVEALYARKVLFSQNLNTISSSQDLFIRFQKNSSSAQLWVDYALINGRKKLNWDKPQLFFNNVFAIANKNDGISIPNKKPIEIWDITEPVRPIEKEVITASSSINTTISELKEYILFDPGAVDKTPNFIDKSKNNPVFFNEKIDMILIYPKQLESAATNLAKHRATHSNLAVKCLELTDITDRYSAGRKDPGAIRNYAKYLYQQHPEFRFLLLFGDASYDYRHLNKDLADENLIPTFETEESLDPLLAFPSDDYFGMLDSGEGKTLIGDIDIAVGRIPVRNISEAHAVVSKIIDYDKNQKNKGKWRLKLAFLADDEDNNLHLNDTERIIAELQNKHPVFNIEKIYWDAFRQESTPGGNRYPEVTKSFNQKVNDGLLVANYLGHGGPRGWSQERVLKHSDVNSWTNIKNLPLIVTATCSFTGFDDPTQTTAGEAVLLNPIGGAVALFTTVRSVYASKNFRLTQSVFRYLFERENGQFLSLGEVMRRAKNDNPTDNTNARKFFMIGDPSMTLITPSFSAHITEINGKNISQFQDTLGAKSLVTIKGEVRNVTGELASNYNGIVEVSLFDKVNKLKTLANDPSSYPREFDAQNSLLFSGKHSVKDGKFESKFYIPNDINYSFGKAKISLYATSVEALDAGGYYEIMTLGGTAQSFPIDNEGPKIEISTRESKSNGLVTGKDPLFIIELEDESGINISNASIGHEITSILDDQSQNTQILNNKFEAQLDDNKKGQVLLRLNDLEPGTHVLKIKAYDVFNNPGESAVTFLVSDSEDGLFDEIINHPNPFSSSTVFQIKHNLKDGSYIAILEIYRNDASKIISKEFKVYSQSGQIDNIILDNLSHIGLTSSGVYFYKFILYSPTKSEKYHSELKKMVFLK